MQMGRDFFKKTFEEGYDSDMEQVEIDTPIDEVDIPEETEVVTPEEEVTDVEIPKFDIDGEVVTIEQLREWKQNGLRQSDYTRKTQELAEQRKRLGSSNDEDEAPTDSDRLAKIERELATKQLDLEITNLKLQYPDFDEIKVLTEADKRGMYNDLEFIYKGLREISTVKEIDVEAIKAQSIAEYKTQIANEKKANKEATSDSIISSVSAPTTVEYGDELTSSEKDFAKKRGWTYKQYYDMKNEQY